MPSASAEPPSPGVSAQQRRWRKLPIVGAITGTAGAVALIFTLWPGLAPDPQSQLNGSMRVLQIEPGVRFGDFAKTHQISLTNKPDFLRGVVGNVIYLEATIQGEKRQTVELHWSIYDAGTRRRLPQSAYNNRVAQGFDPATPSDRTVQEIWTNEPATRRPFFLRFLLSKGKTLFAIADTPRLSARLF